ncbi:MAG TPA: carboxypeptidase regulatory-like domain-containing protein [Longimicrobiaceae bacterium]|nr:carboxypeptidase regulatory-like domain-containing protein [Longimicrobiaceae bacterium]
MPHPTLPALGAALVFTGAAAGLPLLQPVPPPQPQAVVAGTVWDSTSAAPLADARVFLAGTADTVRSDPDGSFRLEHPLEGRYRVGFEHPRLDSLGIDVSGWVVELRRGERTEVLLAVPSLATVTRILCPETALDSLPGIVVGRVRDRATGEGLARVRVALTWTRTGVYGTARGGADVRSRTEGTEVTTDERGRYRVCEVPLRQVLVVRAGLGERLAPAGRFQLRDSLPRLHDVALDRK